MEITTQSYKESDVVKAVGRIDAHAAPQLEETFKALTDAKRYRLVFDMSEVEFLSSAGVRVLISVQNECKRFERGELALACVSENIQETLELAGLQVIFNTYETVLEAVASV